MSKSVFLRVEDDVEAVRIRENVEIMSFEAEVFLVVYCIDSFIQTNSLS